MIMDLTWMGFISAFLFGMTMGSGWWLINRILTRVFG